MDAEDGLPAGWAWAKLGEVCEVNPLTGIGHLTGAEVAFVPMASVAELSNKVDISKRRPVSKVATGFTRFASGDVLFAKITPCMENGKIVVVPDVPGGVGFGSTEFHVLRVQPGIDPLYLRHFIARDYFRRQARGAMSGAVGQQRVPAAFMRDAVIPIPPTAEQVRVMAVVDALFTELDEAEAGLARARAGLADYRASLLHAACTGQLTAAWRTVHLASAEDGPALLRRIAIERRRAWEAAELARLTARNKPPLPGNGWKTRYKEPVPPDLEGLQELPDGWTWASLDQLTHRITSGSRDWGERYAESGPALIRAQNIRTDSLVTAALARVQQPIGDSEVRTRVERDDLLITITGANVTKAARVDVDIGNAFVSQHVGLCRPVLTLTSAFLHLAIVCGSIGRKKLLEAAYGAGKPGLNLQDLGRLPLPLPPRLEQEIILSFYNESVEALEEDSMNLDTLRQSILHSAFTGRLTPQDPADEPAATLLARLRAAPRSRTKAKH